MSEVHEQLKHRRKALGLRQQDMEMRIGMPRQQYQRLESGGNSRLETLELVAKGLKMRVMLIPEEKESFWFVISFIKLFFPPRGSKSFLSQNSEKA